MSRKILLLLAAAALAVLVGCGGDDGGGGSSDEDPQEVLDAAFSSDQTVSSGVLDISVDAAVDGDQGGNVTFSLSGPFQGDADDPTALPQLDWTAEANAEGGGTSFDFAGGLIVTEDNAYVEYQDQAYEVGADMFGQLKSQLEAAAKQSTGGESAEGASFDEAFQQGCEQSIQQQGGDPAACNFAVSEWLGELTNEGTEDVDGTEATHISGDIDVEQMITDLVALGTSVPSAGGTQPTDEQIQQVVDAVDEASFDVYVGTDDDILRQLDFKIGADLSDIPEASASGTSGADIGFSVALSEPNEEQTIEAPSDAAPIDELLGQLGGLGALGGLDSGALGGGSSGGTGGSDPATDCILQATTPEEQQACLEESL